MKSRATSLIVGVIMCSVATGSQSRPSRTAALVIYRSDYKHHWEPASLNPIIAVNGLNLLKIPDRRYFETAIKPGEYVFDANPSKGGKYSQNHRPGQHGKYGSTVAAVIQPGTTCYLAVRQIKPLLLGTWSDHVERVARDQALETLGGLHRLKPKFVDGGVVYKIEPR